MEIKYVKSAARLLDRNWVNKRGLDLSKEVLWVSVDQKAAVLRAVKVEGQKEILLPRLFKRDSPSPGRASKFFFKPTTLIAGSSAAF